MRKALLLLAAVLLAGCTLPGQEDEEAKPAVFGACPHWIAGPDVIESTLDLATGPQTFVVEAIETGDNATAGEGTPANATSLHHAGRDLDLFGIRFNTTETIEVRVVALRDGDERLLIHHVEGGTWQASSFLQVTGEREVQVYLADTAFGAETEPGPIRIDVRSEASPHVDLQITPYYRVCGIPLQEGPTKP